jgi:hypothetical protein
LHPLFFFLLESRLPLPFQVIKRAFPICFECADPTLLLLDHAPVLLAALLARLQTLEQPLVPLVKRSGIVALGEELHEMVRSKSRPRKDALGNASNRLPTNRLSINWTIKLIFIECLFTATCSRDCFLQLMSARKHFKIVVKITINKANSDEDVT